MHIQTETDEDSWPQYYWLHNLRPYLILFSLYPNPNKQARKLLMHISEFLMNSYAHHHHC